MVGLEKERALREMTAWLGVREEDIEEKFIRSQGQGGQDVNKVSPNPRKSWLDIPY